MEITLLRHGQSENNAGLTDNLDSNLTDLGRAQAERAAQRLQPDGLTHLFVSPLRRTLQTIAPLCTVTGQRAEVYADICEYFSPNYPKFQTFDGLTPEEIASQYPFTFVGDTFPCTVVWWPQALEDKPSMAARAVRVRDALLELYGNTDEKLLLVSHAEPLGRMVEAFLRVPPSPQRPPWTDNCGITRLACPSDVNEPAQLVFLNETAHLAGLPAV